MRSRLWFPVPFDDDEWLEYHAKQCEGMDLKHWESSTFYLPVNGEGLANRWESNRRFTNPALLYQISPLVIHALGVKTLAGVVASVKVDKAYSHVAQSCMLDYRGRISNGIRLFSGVKEAWSACRSHFRRTIDAVSNAEPLHIAPPRVYCRSAFQKALAEED